MSKIEQANKNEQLNNIRALAEFEVGKFNKFISDFDKLRKEVNDLSYAVKEKRSEILVKIEEQTALEYEQSLAEMHKDYNEEVDKEQEEQSLSTLNVESSEESEDNAQEIIKEPVIEDKVVKAEEKVKEEPELQPKHEDKQEAINEVKEEVKDESKPQLDIPELKIKSRPKTPKEEAVGRVFIPDNTTKPSGQPINNRFTDNLPRSRRPNEGEVRSRTQMNTSQRPPIRNNNQRPPYPNNNTGTFNNNFNRNTTSRPPLTPRPNALKPAIAPPAFTPKDNRLQTKKKNENKPEDKKSMDKRTLIRRGFVNNVSPGAVYDYESADTKHLKVKKSKKNDFTPQMHHIEKAVITTEMVPIKVLSEKIGKTGAQIIKQLFILGIVKTINESIDFDTAELVANELGIKLELNVAKSSEDKLQAQFNVDAENVDLKPRPPVVTIMGHVDHGKTSLLDYIRKAKVVDSEAGGITQHIGAYTVEINKNKITFLDTPGHEAFTSMRLRGAQVTDIVVIVVAADDGIMPQTVEAIAHAKASNVSIIVAINKMDKRTANPDRIKQQLTEHNLVPEEWGGDIICVPVSAITGEGVDNLLENILLVAEVKELTADYDNTAKGVIIEAQLDKGKGPLATVLVQSGLLKIADYIVAGTVTGKVRAMIDDKGMNIKSAGPSQPVQILGFDEVPQAGDTLMGVSDEKLAKKVVEDRRVHSKSTMTINKTGTSLEDMFSRMSEGEIKDLNVIIKGDVQGSVEAIKQELMKQANEEVKVNVVQANVGAITESDVMLAESSNSIIIGFNVRPDSKAKKMAERASIDVRVYRIIYDIINDISLALKGMLKPKFSEKIIGRAEVRMVFKITGSGTIAGCYVIEDKIIRNAKVRLLRNNVIVYEGEISSLKRMKDDVKEVAQGYECGISISGYNDIKENDIIEAYIIEEIKI